MKPGFAVQAAYAAPSLVLALLAMTFHVYLSKFYKDVIGIDGALFGLIVFLSRTWDAVIDPGIGLLSDRTRSRWGRRLPWMAAAAAPTAVAFLMLMMPPAWAGAGWLAAWLPVFFLFWGCVTIPYEALGPELSRDYHGRTRVFGLREGAFIVGTMLAVVLPAVLETSPPDSRGLYRTLGPLYAALFVAAVAWCVFGVPERPLGEAQRPRGGALSNLMALLRHRPARALLGSYALASLAGALVSTLILFYVERVLGSGSGSRFLVVFFGATLLFVPAWISLSRRIGKRSAWQLSLTVGAIAGGAVFFLGPGDAALFRVLLALSGAAYGATLALAPSMQADVIDYDEWASGARREGAFVGGWAIVRKLVMALGAAAPFPILKAFGYELSPIPEEARLALRSLYALAPCACMLAAAAVLFAYPIDRAMHDRIRADLAARSAAANG